MILVTGGAGFIGSHLVDALVVGGHEVRVLDSLHPGAHDGPPPYLNPGAEYRFGDVCDPGALAGAFAGVDGVAHQAAMVGLGVDFGDAVDYVRHNDLGTASLLGELHHAGFAGSLVLGSSMAVYGEGRYTCPVHGGVERPSPRDPGRLAAGEFEPRCPRCEGPLQPESVPEETPPEPRNVYAATKLHQEHLCAAFGREHPEVPVTMLRYHNVYGPRMPRDTPYAGVASIFRSALEAGRAPEVYEDGAQRRDFVHVTDVARANVLALTGAGSPGTYNVASGDPRSVLDMAAAISAVFGPGAPTPRVTGAFRAGDVRHVFASPARASRDLGFTAEVGFAAGMAEFATATLRAPVAGQKLAGRSRSRLA